MHISLQNSILHEPAEHLILRWLNYHLARAGYNQPVSDFGVPLRVPLSILFSWWTFLEALISRSIVLLC